MTDLSELEKLARAATPGPWRWEVSLSARQVELCGGPPKSGFGKFDHSVISFKRWGMGGAAPVFWSWDGHLGKPQRADDVAVPVEGREHHAAWFRDIDHPNAAYIAAANPATILALIAASRERDALRAGLERIINECPATCETSPAHNMADIARQLLTPRSETEEG